MKRSKILGLEGVAVNQVGIKYFFLFCGQVVHEQTKEATVLCSLGHKTLWNSA